MASRVATAEYGTGSGICWSYICYGLWLYGEPVSEKCDGSEIAPIQWINNSLTRLFKSKKNLDPKKIMVGLPFYGYFFFPNGHKAVTKKEYLQILQGHEPKLHWNEDVCEHKVQILDKHGGPTIDVAFPTLKVSLK